MGRSRFTFAAVALALGLVVAVGCAPTPNPMDEQVHLNQIQTIGSHNSYHLLADEPERTLRRSFIGSGEDSLEYTHGPLGHQFSSEKVRQIELDVFDDPNGGLYADPLIRNAVNGGPYDPAMNQPGIKVLHIQDVDYHSNCITLILCLQTVKAWSDANPRHVPLTILLELKDTPLVLGGIDFVDPLPFNAAAMDRLDGEIRSVFSEDEMITPDDVRGSHATLEEAVLQDGWPTLGDSRGKVMFLMDNSGGYRTTYLGGHPSLAGRVLFTNSNPGQADAAFVERNDAKGSLADIQNLVAEGYVVRTRADADTVEARAGDTSTRDAALASGAQWVSTDYPVPSLSQQFGTGYSASIPGGVAARCNPINGPTGCVSFWLDTVYIPKAPAGP